MPQIILNDLYSSNQSEMLIIPPPYYLWENSSEIINITDETAFNAIKSILSQKSYVECGNCGAVKIDAKNEAESLDSFENRCYNSTKEDLELESLADLAGDILRKLIEPEPEFNKIDDWEQWDAENCHRKCNFLDPNNDEYDMYIRYSDVVIYFDKNTQKYLFNRYSEILKETGYLFLGHSESMFKVSNRFNLIGKTIYQNSTTENQIIV